MTGLSRQPEDVARFASQSGAAARAQAVCAAMAQLKAQEDDLVDQSIAFAKTNGYAPYTTTIRAAWVEAVRSLTEALADYMADPATGPQGPQAEVKYRQDPRFTRMRRIARKHRSVGITLEMYLGLFKHFRRVYLDALDHQGEDIALRSFILQRALHFFDETELSVTADWTATGGDARLKEMQAQTRSLTLAKDRYIAIFESLRNPACLLDRSRGLVHANRAALDMFMSETQAGDSLYRHDRRALIARVEEMLGQVLDAEDGAGSNVWIDTVDGRRCFDVRLLRLQDEVDNTALGYLVQLYDVTAYREATDTAQRAEHQMSRFLATMSHEIRTPLHAVLGAADLLRHTADTERGGYLDIIQSAGQSLLHTLTNVLDYSKMESGPPTPRPVEIEIGPALQSFCGMATVARDAGAPRLSLAIAPDVPPQVSLDWAMTRQVLTNLVFNALRHDQGGGVVVCVRPVGAMLRFEVVDHGPGLQEKDAAALFRSFDEASARLTDTGGTGLGLAISRYLVTAMGGRIDYRTRADGTTIWFDLPATAVGRREAKPRAEGPTTPGPRRRCLLVDDDEIGAPVTLRQLELAGFAVDHAVSLRTARAAFAQHRYDAVVVDYLLPDGTGPDLVAEISAAYDMRQTRFVALTANAEAVLESAGLRAHFAQVLAKPTDAGRLAEALNAERPMAKADPGEPATRAWCDGLLGLSEEAIAAMAGAFARQWEEFRLRLGAMAEAPAPSAALDELRETAHRLAGSSAQLGLREIEGPLRDLEAQLETRDADVSECAALKGRLDVPLEALSSWRRLQMAEARP